ncbi:MAG: T9SS type A sorting domain-containing protein [Candidatus Cloacimonetes bacterium]|nr:T9SS type A sorting domain-containing protein [Candidatus Cloacimonadota bacterium]
MKKYLLFLLFISLTSLLFSQSFRDENTVDLRISNARTDNGVFKMDVELKRTSSWPFTVPNIGYDDLLWNGDLQFSYNTLGFTEDPTFTDLNPNLDTAEYSIAISSAGISLTFSIIGPISPTTTLYNPTLNEWEPVCSIEWNISDPYQNSGIDWSTSGTGLISAAGFPSGLLTNTFYGSGDISLLSAEPSFIDPVLCNIQSAPNPFGSYSPSTELFITSPDKGQMELNVFNIKGQLVGTLFNNPVQKNQDIQLSWDGKDSHGNDLSSGIYLYQLLIENKLFETKKIVLIR